MRSGPRRWTRGRAAYPPAVGAVTSSGEIDIIGQTLLAGARQQLLHRGDLRLPSTPPDKDDNAGMFALRTQREDVVAITRNEHGAMRTRPLPGVGIRRRGGQYFAQHVTTYRRWRSQCAKSSGTS